MSEQKDIIQSFNNLSIQQKHVFKPEYIDQVFQKDTIEPLKELKDIILLTYIDPKSSSSESKLSLTTLCCTLNDSIIIVGMETISSSNAFENIQSIEAYFKAFSSNQDIKNIPHILLVDNNFCGIGPDFYYNIAQKIIPNISVYYQSDSITSTDIERFNKLEALHQTVMDWYEDNIYIYTHCNTSIECMNSFKQQLKEIKWTNSSTWIETKYDLVACFLITSWYTRKYNKEMELKKQYKQLIRENNNNVETINMETTAIITNE